MISKIKDLFSALTLIEEKLGIRKFMEYCLLICFVYCVFNFESVVKFYMDVQEKVAKEEHMEKLRLRDELMEELSPLLVELRTHTGAQRVLYFEYHNSTENFLGIPFKYSNLVAFNQDYKAPGFDQTKYKDINSGLIGNLYNDLKKEGIVIADEHGKNKYPEIHEFFSSQDGSYQHVFINIPGIDAPVGMIVLEWTEDKQKLQANDDLEKWILKESLPRINSLIISKSCDYR